MSFKAKHLIYPVRKECKLIVEGVFPVRVSAEECYSLEILPFSGLRKYGLRHTSYIPTEADEVFLKERHPLTVCGEALTLNVTWPQEDCYICNLFVGDVKVETMEVYALEEDLFAKNPYKGDHHLHSIMSDGKETPVYMAAAACRNGYDYCVITDHNCYKASLLTRDFYQPSGVDFMVIPGEEVHSPDNPVHIINLGGNKSVVAWFQEHEDEYRAAVAEELKKMDDPMTDKDRYAAAASQVMFDKIHEAHGVAVLCHPNWIIPTGFNEHEDITDYLFDHKRFDALELIAGGAYEVGTQMQVSYYKDRPKIPVLGNSDSHNCFVPKGKVGLEPGNYTIVLADALDPDAVKEAIRAGRSVAADDNKFYGEYRLVKYAYFLQRNYFPGHDQKRFELGAAMLRMASSQDSSDPKLVGAVQNPRPSRDFEPLRYKDE